MGSDGPWSGRAATAGDMPVCSTPRIGDADLGLLCRRYAFRASPQRGWSPAWDYCATFADAFGRNFHSASDTVRRKVESDGAIELVRNKLSDDGCAVTCLAAASEPEGHRSPAIRWRAGRTSHCATTTSEAAPDQYGGTMPRILRRWWSARAQPWPWPGLLLPSTSHGDHRSPHCRPHRVQTRAERCRAATRQPSGFGSAIHASAPVPLSGFRVQP